MHVANHFLKPSCLQYCKRGKQSVVIKLHFLFDSSCCAGHPHQNLIGAIAIIINVNASLPHCTGYSGAGWDLTN